MKKTAFLDFDDVLFDTRAFVRALKAIFVLAGLNVEECENAYQEFRGNLAKEKKPYSLQEHINFFSKKFPKIDRAVLEGEMAILKREMPRFVFEDALDFLRHISDNGWQRIIVSFGDKSWQEEKIHSCGLGSLAEKVVVSQDKSKVNSVEEVLKNVGETADAIFIDDNRDRVLALVKARFPRVKTFQLIRPELESIRVRHKECDYDCRSLEEVEGFIA